MVLLCPLGSPPLLGSFFASTMLEDILFSIPNHRERYVHFTITPASNFTRQLVDIINNWPGESSAIAATLIMEAIVRLTRVHERFN